MLDSCLQHNQIDYATSWVVNVFPTDKKPVSFTCGKAVKACHCQEREGMWSRALTYLASVIDHVGLIPIRSLTAATVSCISEKSVVGTHLYAVHRLYTNHQSTVPLAIFIQCTACLEIHI